jgi:hypothetical protein
LDYSEIVPDRLWIGGSPSRDDLIRLRNQLGPELVVMDLTQDPEEKKLCEELGIDYDDRTPEVTISEDNSVPLGRLKIVSAIIGDNIDSGHKVLLHCSMGKGRSPTCAAAYLIVSGMSLQEAKKAVVSKRPVWLGADASYARALDYLAEIMELTRG